MKLTKQEREAVERARKWNRDLDESALREIARVGSAMLQEDAEDRLELACYACGYLAGVRAEKARGKKEKKA